MSFMFGRRTSLRELIRSQHEEFMRYQERREEEWRLRDAEFREESGQRAKEAERRAKEFERRAKESRQREERLDRLVEETREYNREILLRNEKVYKSVLVRLEEMGKEIRESTAQIRSSTEESRAQTQALLRLIDRFDEPGGAAAA